MHNLELTGDELDFLKEIISVVIEEELYELIEEEEALLDLLLNKLNNLTNQEDK